MRKLIPVMLAALLGLALAVDLVGCRAEKEMTAEEIRDAVVEAWANIETTQFDMNSTWNITKKNGEPAGIFPLLITLTGTGILDEVNQEMKVEMEMTLYLPPEGGAR
jgi:hypothetical protein